MSSLERVETLLIQVLEEMRAQTEAIHQLVQSNALLIDALADEADHDPGAPATFLDGSPAGSN